MMGRTLPASSTRDTSTVLHLRRTLARVAAPDADLRASLREAAHGPEDLIRLVARQIEETVLPRSYALIADRQDLARLSISNRRLMALSLVTQETDIGADEGALSAAQIYARRLHALARDAAGPVRLHLLGRASGLGGGMASCSARALVESFAALGGDGGLDGFFELLSGQCLAWLRVEGGQGETGSDGPADVLATLRRLLPEHGRTGCPKVGQKPACTVIALGDAGRAVIATDGAACMLALVPEAALAAVLAAWKASQRPAQAAQRP